MRDVAFVPKPFLHILIPAYGTSPFLEETLFSTLPILSEIVLVTVIDDGSVTDDVFNICQKFPQIEYVKNPKNIGITKVFCQAFNLSKGEFTVVCGSDDRFKTNYVDALIAAVQRFPDVDAVQPSVKVIDANGDFKVTLVDFIKSFIRGFLKTQRIRNSNRLILKLAIGDWLYFPAIAWRTKLLKEFDWKINFSTAIDLYLLFQFANKDKKLFELGEVAFDYRRHSKSVSSQLNLNSKRFIEEMIVHGITKRSIAKNLLQRTALEIAITSRLQAIIIGLKILRKNRYLGLEILKNSIRPLSYFENLISQ